MFVKLVKKVLQIVRVNKLVLNDIDRKSLKMVNKFLLLARKVCRTTCNFIVQ